MPCAITLSKTKSFVALSDIINFELDGYQLKRLEQLGLYEPPKPEDDGSEFISRI